MIASALQVGGRALIIAGDAALGKFRGARLATTTVAVCGIVGHLAV